ncbi:uncharacterized protein [Antedon mediterranea]|uniref:uncharacterized protein isoform X4 n=1 Tax=Antedon mediterranea TaxID=105859 RepID=UPI003AF9A8E0
MNVYIIAALHLLLLFIVNGAPVNEYTQTYEKYKTNITNSLECSATADDDRVQKLFEEDKLEPSSPSLFLACATPDSDQQTTVCKAILDKLSKICNNAKAKTILDYNVFAVLHTRLDKSMASENEDRIREAVKMITDIGSLDEQICEPSTPLRVACLLLWQIKEAEETTRTTSAATKFPTDKAENEKVDQNRHDSNNNDEPPLLKENEHPDPDLPNKVGTSTTNTGSTFESDKPITPNSKEVSGETTLNNGDEPKQVGGETSENKEDEGKEPTVGNKTSENNEAKEPNAGGENNEDEKEETNVGGENKEDEGKEPNDGGKTSESDEDERKKPNVDGETSENNEDKGKKPNGGESSENNEDEGKEPNIDGETSENNEDERKKPNVDGETSENNEDEGKKPNVDGETSENNEDEWKKPNVDGETSENNEDERKKPNVDGKTSENNEDELKKQNVGGETSENNEDEGKEPNVSDGASENNEDENNKSDIGGGNKEDEEDQSKDNSSEDDYDSVPAPDSSFEDNEKNVQKYKPNIGGDFGKDDYYLKENQKTYDSFKNRKFEEEESSSHFLAYSLTAIILILATYIAYHNKRKIIAVIIEGRGKNGKRGGSYRRLNQNVSDAMPTLKA